MKWQEINPGVQWLLIHENRVLRQVLKLGPYLGAPNPTYRVTGYDGTEQLFTDHLTSAEAIAAAEESTLERYGGPDL